MEPTVARQVCRTTFWLAPPGLSQRGVVFVVPDDFVEPDEFEPEKVSRMLPIDPPDFG